MNYSDKDTKERCVQLALYIIEEKTGIYCYIGHWSGEYYGECIQSRCYVLYYEAF